MWIFSAVSPDCHFLGSIIFAFNPLLFLIGKKLFTVILTAAFCQHIWLFPRFLLKSY